MGYLISRHDASKEGYRRYLEGSEEDRRLQVSRIERKSSYIDFAFQNLKLEANFRLAMDPQAMDVLTWDSWTTYMQIAEVLFAVSAAPPGSTVERLIAREVRSLDSVNPGTSINGENWLTAFFLSVTCRDNERSRSLCEVPVDLLRCAGEGQGRNQDDYVFPWISAIQDLVLGRPTLSDNLLAAMELSEPGRIRAGTAHQVDHLVFPQIHSLYRLSQQDAESLNEALGQGLLLFRDYFTRSEEREKSLEGVIPLGLLAIACMTRDMSQVRSGFDLTVRSEYLPEGILNETWRGSYPI